MYPSSCLSADLHCTAGIPRHFFWSVLHKEHGRMCQKFSYNALWSPSFITCPYVPKDIAIYKRENIRFYSVLSHSTVNLSHNPQQLPSSVPLGTQPLLRFTLIQCPEFTAASWTVVEFVLPRKIAGFKFRFFWTEDQDKPEKLCCYRCKNWGVNGDWLTELHGMEMIIILHTIKSESSICCVTEIQLHQTTVQCKGSYVV